MSAVKPLSAEEKKAALDLVDEIQATRETRSLTPDEVPKVLLPYQADWHADLEPVRLADKSRRIGFTWGGMAAEAALEAALQPSAGGMDQSYMGYSLRMAAEFIGDCAFFAKAYGLACTAIDPARETVIIDNEDRDIITYKIRFASGFVVEALSNAPHNWRGRQGHARIDEAAFHPNLGEVIKGAMAFLMWGGRVDVVSTHNGEDNIYNDYIKQIKAGTLDWSYHKTTFDDALRQGFYRRVCLVKGWEWSQEAEEKYRAAQYARYPNPEDAAEELDCIPKRGSGAYFSRMLVESCQDADIPTLRFAQPAEFVLAPNRLAVTRAWLEDVVRPHLAAIPTDKRTGYGQDFGRDGDLSVIWPGQEIAPKKWRVPFSVELRRIPFDCQQLIAFYILDELPLMMRAHFDARGNGQSHAEACLQRYGESRVGCIQATPAFYSLWFPRYHRAYEDHGLIVPGGEDVVADHQLVVLTKGRPTMADAKIKGTDGGQRHGDSATAGLMLWSACNDDGQPAAGATINKPQPQRLAAESRLGIMRPQGQLFRRR